MSVINLSLDIMIVPLLLVGVQGRNFVGRSLTLVGRSNNRRSFLVLAAPSRRAALGFAASSRSAAPTRVWLALTGAGAVVGFADPSGVWLAWTANAAGLFFSVFRIIGPTAASWLLRWRIFEWE